MPRNPRKNVRLAVLDLETDPFEFNQIPVPFCSGFYDGEDFYSVWGPDCVAKLVAHLATIQEPLIIFAHNGGKFDFFYFLEHIIDNDMRIINGRIVKAHLGHHEIRDSFAIMPFRLADYMKDEIDYNKLKRDVREKHKVEILKYLKSDCVYLHELVVAFFAEFGDKLTVGSAAMQELKKFHDFDQGGKFFDEKFREPFYFGGRNQCFETGIVRGNLKIYDVNSMYPDSMRSYLHPVGIEHTISTKIESDTCFVVAEGHNAGAFPTRMKDGGLNFNVPYGRFSTTIHEWNAALDVGAFRPTKIIKTYGFDKRITFEEFVNHFYNSRKKAKKDGDKIRTLFYKFVLNSAYGKFAQNPENFFEWCITKGDVKLEEKCPKCPEDSTDSECAFCEGHGFLWTPAVVDEYGRYIIWNHPIEHHTYFNVCTGSSITGAARSILLRGIAGSTRPIYCDTDSIICERLSGVRLDDDELGAWKLEGTGTHAAICGKKLYAVFGPGECCECRKGSCAHTGGRVRCVKKANKGARLTGNDILKIARGGEVESRNPVPTFKLTGKHEFSVRRIKRTA